MEYASHFLQASRIFSSGSLTITRENLKKLRASCNLTTCQKITYINNSYTTPQDQAQHLDLHQKQGDIRKGDKDMSKLACVDYLIEMDMDAPHYRSEDLKP